MKASGERDLFAELVSFCMEVFLSVSRLLHDYIGVGLRITASYAIFDQ